MTCADGAIITELESRIGKLPDQAALHYNGTWYVKVSALKGVMRSKKATGCQNTMSLQAAQS